jgi:hypothetical protein
MEAEALRASLSATFPPQDIMRDAKITAMAPSDEGPAR